MPSITLDNLCIPLSRLEEGVSTFTFRKGDFGLCVGEGRCFPCEVFVEARVTTLRQDFLVDLKVESEGEFVCDRCAVAFRKLIKGEVRTLFTFDSGKVGEESEDVRFLPSSAHEIDITQDVIDALVLTVPVKVLCREACRGLCPRCGKNLNEGDCSCSNGETDPRWNGVKGLKFGD